MRVPGSKSLTNRELILSAIAETPSKLRHPLRSRDTLLMLNALRALGTTFDETETTIAITPAPLHGPASIDCGLAGTVMRFVPPLAALADGDIHFDADPQAYARPMGTTLNALTSLGVSIDGDGLPFTVHGAGAIGGGTLEIDASGSSQFVSGLLLAAPRFLHGLDLRHIGNQLPSLPHIAMTIDALSQRGVVVTVIGDDRWRVDHGPVDGRSLTIEPDLSNAAPFLAAAAITGGSVTIPDWPQATSQVGDLFPNILERMGARVTTTADTVTVHGTGQLHGIDVDMSACGELVPTVAAVAALATGPTTIKGVAHLRGHETNRLEALAHELTAIGCPTTELTDGLHIAPSSDALHGTEWHAYADHRMATCGAIIGLAVPGVTIDDIGCTAKTLPEFPKMWHAMIEAVDITTADVNTGDPA